MMEFETVRVGGHERFVTPVDATGIPFCFAPTVLPPVRARPPLNNNGVFERQADLNHMWPKHDVATSQSPALANPIAQAALTGARVQWVDFEQHHGIYNNDFVGPPLPQTDAALFQTLAMATAGYVPEHAIDLSGETPKIVGLTAKRRKWFWTSSQVAVMSQPDVSRYLLGFVLGTEVDHIGQREVEDFIYEPDGTKKLQRGHQLIEKIVERAVEPIEGPYQEARRQNVLSFVHVGSRKRAAPTNPRDLVKSKLRAGSGFGPVQDALQHRLAAVPHRPRSMYVDG